MSVSLSELTHDQIVLLNSLLKQANELNHSSKLEDKKKALQLYEQAYSLCTNHQKLAQKIARLKVLQLFFNFLLTSPLPLTIC